MSLADLERKAGIELVAQRTDAAKALAILQVERAKANGARQKVEAELGPVRYLATLLGAKELRHGDQLTVKRADDGYGSNVPR